MVCGPPISTTVLHHKDTYQRLRRTQGLACYYHADIWDGTRTGGLLFYYSPQHNMTRLCSQYTFIQSLALTKCSLILQSTPARATMAWQQRFAGWRIRLRWHSLAVALRTEGRERHRHVLANERKYISACMWLAWLLGHSDRCALAALLAGWLLLIYITKSLYC